MPAVAASTHPEMKHAAGKSPGTSRLLVVDDDPLGLRYLTASLGQLDFEVDSAFSARDARHLLEQAGTGAFECIIADYRMPEETGLDLLRWIRAADPTLSTIIVTAEGEMALVQSSLREGAVDFLEKPLSRPALKQAVDRAVETTRRERKTASTQREVSEVGKLTAVFEVTEGRSAIAGRVQYFYKPANEVGGDFLTILPNPVNDNECLIAVGDVSGHDFPSGFISAQFQGMLRGLAQAGTPPEAILVQLNDWLCASWQRKRRSGGGEDGGNPPARPVSVALQTVHLNIRDNTLALAGCGSPPSFLLMGNGRVARVPPVGPPLGWMAGRRFQLADFESGESVHSLYLMTDGVLDHAEAHELSPLSLAYRLLFDAAADTQEIVANARDDLLVLHLPMTDTPPAPAMAHPLIHEHYAGDEADQIDQLQTVWRRSLRFALPETFHERLYDVLLCLREAVLNALVHGCERSAAKTCTVDVSWDPAARILRCRVDDPGSGHHFGVSERVQRLGSFEEQKLGLAIIARLSDAFATENQGATVVFEFSDDLHGRGSQR